MRHPVAVTLILAVTVPACDGVSPTQAAAPCTDEVGTVAVTVGQGLEPTIDWEPRCAIAFLNIEAGASDQWGFAVNEDLWDDPSQANIILPPLTYGVLPAGTEEFRSPTALLEGITYDVNLARVITAGASPECLAQFGNFCLMATYEFTR